MILLYCLLLSIHLVAMSLQKSRFLETEDEAESAEVKQAWLFPVFGTLWFFGLFSPLVFSCALFAEPMTGLVLGLSCFGLGFIIRVKAYRNLGRMFTYDLGLRKTHALITGGIHGWMRHPSYTGTLLIHVGLGLVANSWLAIILTVGSIAFVLHTRVQREEALLHSQFGTDWELYAASTGRWWPRLSLRTKQVC